MSALLIRKVMAYLNEKQKENQDIGILTRTLAFLWMRFTLHTALKNKHKKKLARICINTKKEQSWKGEERERENEFYRKLKNERKQNEN